MTEAWFTLNEGGGFVVCRTLRPGRKALVLYPVSVGKVPGRVLRAVELVRRFYYLRERASIGPGSKSGPKVALIICFYACATSSTPVVPAISDISLSGPAVLWLASTNSARVRACPVTAGPSPNWPSYSSGEIKLLQSDCLLE